MSKDKQFFEQLNTKTIADSPASTIQSQSNPVHLERSNKELLSSIKLVNDATLRSDGGPIPGTLVIRQIVSDADGTKFTLNWVNPGEVWKVYGFCVATMTGRSGSVIHEVFIVDNGNNLLCEIIDVSASSSQLPLHEAGPGLGAEILVDENTSINYEASGTFTDSTLQFVTIRVR